MKHTRRFSRSKRYLCWLRGLAWLRDNPPIWFDEWKDLSAKDERTIRGLIEKSRSTIGVDWGAGADIVVAIETRRLPAIPELGLGEWVTIEREISLEEARRLFWPVHPKQVLMLATPETVKLWGGKR